MTADQIAEAAGRGFNVLIVGTPTRQENELILASLTGLIEGRIAAVPPTDKYDCGYDPALIDHVDIVVSRQHD